MLSILLGIIAAQQIFQEESNLELEAQAENGTLTKLVPITSTYEVKRVPAWGKPIWTHVGRTEWQPNMRLKNHTCTHSDWRSWNWNMWHWDKDEEITEVKFMPRTDGWQHRYKGLKVHVGNVSCGVWPSLVESEKTTKRWITFKCPNGTRGTFARISMPKRGYLSICGIQVYKRAEFEDSQILTESMREQISTLPEFEGKKLTNIYSGPVLGSTDDFHKHVDGKSPTVAFYQIERDDRVFGMYTQIVWSKSAMTDDGTSRLLRFDQNNNFLNVVKMHKGAKWYGVDSQCYFISAYGPGLYGKHLQVTFRNVEWDVPQGTNIGTYLVGGGEAKFKNLEVYHVQDFETKSKAAAKNTTANKTGSTSNSTASTSTGSKTATTTSAATNTSNSPYNSSYALSVKVGIEIVRLTNQFRQNNSVSPQQIWNKDLHDECYRHSIYMANKKQISHDNMLTRWKWMKALGYKAVGVAENVAMNMGGTPLEAAAMAVNQWINSPGHRRNMLRPTFNMQSASVFVKDRRWYYCQMFIIDKSYTKDNSGQTEGKFPNTFPIAVIPKEKVYPTTTKCTSDACKKSLQFGKLLQAKLTAYRRANNILDPEQKWNDFAHQIAFDNAKYGYEKNLGAYSFPMWSNNMRRWSSARIAPMKCLGQNNCPLKNIKDKSPAGLAQAAMNYIKTAYGGALAKNAKKNYDYIGAAIYCGTGDRCYGTIMYFRSHGGVGSKNNKIVYNS